MLTTYIDCRIASAEDENLFQEGEVPLGCELILPGSPVFAIVDIYSAATRRTVGIWGFKASQECLIPLVRLVLAAKPPTYESVMELDRKIRDLAMPRAEMQGQTDRTAISMRNFVRSHYQELSTCTSTRADVKGAYRKVLYIFSADVSSSSFLRPSYDRKSRKSVTKLVQPVSSRSVCKCVWCITRHQSTVSEEALALHSDMENVDLWFHGCCERFNTGYIKQRKSSRRNFQVIVGTIAVKGVHLNLQPPPLAEFEAICKIFENASETSNRAARAMVRLGFFCVGMG